MSLEQLVFLAIFLAIALFNFLRQVRAQQRRRREEAELPPPPLEPEPVTLPPRDILVLPSPRPAPPPPPSPRPPAARREVERRIAPQAVMRARPRRLTRREVRRGFVLMSLLGTCPGLERPPEADRRP